MILAVDIGNTKTEIGLVEGGRVVARARFPTARSRGEAPVAGVGLWLGRQSATPDGMAIGCVVPAAAAAWDDVARVMGFRTRYFGEGGLPGLPVHVDEPEAVGPDRLVNCLGALARFAPPLIVCDLGTATTVDVVDATGAFIGGAIAPGAGTALEALSRKAARLPTVALAAPERAIGRNTIEAMQSGAFLGYVSLVDGLVERMREELQTSAPCIATGGLATLFAPHCRTFTAVDDGLTLLGLARAWELTE